ncbi:MAG: type II toxin-antitoxin system VapC family toxin [Burkholderiales bacterium]|nr:type II toxin-antitoxin system VapC family toxin [Burkholderiales bacterium]
MPALDTNVLVRYIVQDDLAQFAAAQKLIRRCVDEQLTLFVPITVTLELEWVLRSNYALTKDETIRVLSELFSAEELSFESDRALEVALDLYRDKAADFADCVHIALAVQAGEQQLWTFDKNASKTPGAQLLTRQT